MAKKKKQQQTSPAHEPATSASKPVGPATPRGIFQSASPLHGRVERSLSMHFGPLPPPEELAQYDAIVPHLAENIVQWTTNEQGHRHSMEDRAIELDKRGLDASIREGRIGQFLAFIVAIAGFGTAYKFATLGFPWAGTTIFGTTLLGIIWCFVFGSKIKASESIEQIQQILLAAKKGTNGNRLGNGPHTPQAPRTPSR